MCSRASSASAVEQWVNSDCPLQVTLPRLWMPARKHSLPRKQHSPSSCISFSTSFSSRNKSWRGILHACAPLALPSIPLLLWHLAAGDSTRQPRWQGQPSRDSLAGSSSQRHLHLAQRHMKLGTLISPAGFPTGTWFQLGHATYASVPQKQPGANTPMQRKHAENR